MHLEKVRLAFPYPIICPWPNFAWPVGTGQGGNEMGCGPNRIRFKSGPASTSKVSPALESTLPMLGGSRVIPGWTLKFTPGKHRGP